MDLTRDQVNTILKNAPIGTDKTKILDELIKKGYNLEGIDSESRRKDLSIQSQQADKMNIGYSDTGEDIKQIGTDIISSAKEGVKTIKEAANAGIEDKQNPFRTAFQQVGAGLGAVSNIFGDIIKGAVKVALPNEAQKSLKGGMESVITPVIQNDIAKGILEKYNSLDDAQKRDIDAALGIGSFALDVTGAGVGKKATETGIKVAKEGVERVGKTALKAGEAIGQGLDTGVDVLKGAGGISENALEQAKRIPGRIMTNIEETKAVNQAIRELPSETAKTAVRNGIDLNDIKYISNISNEEKSTIKQLWNTVKNYASGNQKINPTEIVGKPIVERIKGLEQEATKVGKQLGEVANNLGTVSKEESTQYVFDSLKKVPGLESLELNEKGVLNFKNTVLSSRDTLSDRKAIQSIFNDATKSGTGKQKHLLRQELFESLGGKKKSLSNLTDTQEKAYEAIRKGLSDLLDTKNSSYKQLNSQYRQIVQPLMDIRKFTKGLSDVNQEDLYSLAYGLLSRRLTSNAQSNPQIRALIRALDSSGQLEKQVDTLQNMYNIFDKYYDIAGKTTLQGQSQRAIEKSIPGFIYNAAEKAAGVSDTVKQKSLEKLLNEILK